MTLLLANVGCRCFAFEIATVAAVLPLPRFHRPAAMPRPLLGFVNAGGRTTAVLAPLSLLTETDPPVPDLRAHLLLLAGAGPSIALLVDRASDVRSVAVAEMRPVAPENSSNGCIVGLVDAGGATAELIAPDRLLIEAERQQIAALSEAMTRRIQAAIE